MKNLSFKEWFKLKEVTVGQVTPATVAINKEIEKAIIDAGAGAADPKLVAKTAVQKLKVNQNFIKNKEQELQDTIAAAAAKKPATPATGANPAAKTF
mgnify:CR=1 FL=1